MFNRARSFFTDPEYYRTLVRLAGPIALQSLISSSLNFVSVFMIGQLGEVPIASIGLANQVWFLLNLMVFGISSGTSMFVAQLWGKKDIPNIRRVVGLTVKLGLAAAILFFTIAFFLPAVRVARVQCRPGGDRHRFAISAHHGLVVWFLRHDSGFQPIVARGRKCAPAGACQHFCPCVECAVGIPVDLWRKRFGHPCAWHGWSCDRGFDRAGGGVYCAALFYLPQQKPTPWQSLPTMYSTLTGSSSAM